MITKEQEDAIRTWQGKFGGYAGHPKGGALKTLGECIEFAFASGASLWDIEKTVFEEIKKAQTRNEIGSIDPMRMGEEAADVSISITACCLLWNLDQERVITEKIKVLLERDWEPDENGTLRRPGRTHT